MIHSRNVAKKTLIPSSRRLSCLWSMESELRINAGKSVDSQCCCCFWLCLESLRIRVCLGGQQRGFQSIDEAIVDVSDERPLNPRSIILFAALFVCVFVVFGHIFQADFLSVILIQPKRATFWVVSLLLTFVKTFGRSDSFYHLTSVQTQTNKIIFLNRISDQEELEIDRKWINIKP